MSGTELDLLIVGAGPCGLAAAISAKRAGLRAAVLDQGPVVSAILAYPTYATFFSTAPKLSLGGLPFTIAHDKPDRRDALAYYRSVVEYFDLDVRQYERVEAIDGKRGAFTVRSRTQTGTRLTTTRAVIVATGYWGSPNMLGVPGEELPHVTHAYREGHEAFQQDAVVVGGANSAAEAALDLWRAGARVTLVHFGATFDQRANGQSRIKPWVLPDIENRIAEGNIAARWNSRVTGIDSAAVTIAGPDGEQRIPAQHVYLMTGFKPNDALLKQAGVSIDARTGVPAHDPETLETDVPGIYVVGVLVAGFDANKVFIENGRFHGDRVVAHLTGNAPPGEASVSDDPDA